MTEKARRAAVFCFGNSKPLILPHMLGLDIVSFPHNMFLLFFCLIFFNLKKKIEGEDA
jgi:hypothetical protein